MGKVIAPVTSMFGIGQKDDPTYNPLTGQSGAYNKFANEADQNFGDAQHAAANQLTTNAFTGGLYGDGGLTSQLQSEGKDLASRGYELRPEDREAYGQTAGDIARQFGQQEQDASKMLARRGLGGGASGASGATFSGLAGSKNEMLAKAQTDIAQKRMQDTQQRLLSNRQMQQSLGTQGQQLFNNMAQQRFDNKGNALKSAAGIESGVNDQGRQANEDAIGHKSKNIGDAWAEGKYSGTKSGEADATASWMKMGGSSSMGMSDENNKTNIGSGGGAARGFLKQIANSQDLSAAPSSSGGEQKKEGGSPMDMMSMFGGGSGGGEAACGAGGAGGGMGSMMSMFSDEDCKQDVHGGESEIRGFLDSVEPHSYEYKDEYQDNPLAGDGEYVTPMAQELEQTDLGKDMVQDTPDGKIVDYGKGFGTLLAGMADVNKRLSAIEGRKK